MSITAAAPTSHTDLILAALRRFPERIAFEQGSRAWTYRECADLLARLSTVLHNLGVRPGRGVGVLSPNRPEVWLAQVAPGFVGASYTPLHPLGSFEDHLHACDEAELCVLLVDPAYEERAAKLLETSASLKHVLTFGASAVGFDLLELMAAAEPAPLDRLAVDPEATHWLLYTGGTSGVPKAAELPQRAVAQTALSVSTGWDLPAKRRYLAVTPVSHSGGLLIGAVLLSGGTVLMQRAWDPQEWLDTIARKNVTLGLLVPTMIYSLLDSHGLDQADLSSLETIMYGASPMASARLIEGLERMGPIFCQLYGQTESTGLGASLWRHQHDPTEPSLLASCGQVVSGMALRILDDDGNVCADGTAGEICLRGPSIMNGYLKRPELTAETLVNGWLRTGDIGVQDDGGFVHIVDRKKDLIISGGFNIYPAEVEQVLMSHSAVASAAVIGVPHEKWGEAVKAVVVRKPGMDVAASHLVELVKERKGSHHAPKSIEFVDTLPLTPVGKPDKKVLRASQTSSE